jgi:biotin-dependent carboxylase-like uncharacterized protein
VIEILDPGPLTTVQDGGRRGWASLGVPRSGAFDRAAWAAANRLVGNVPGAAGLEITLGGLALRTDQAVTIALTGAPCPGAPDWNVAVTLHAGTELRLGQPRHGLRSYLAVRGGLDVPAVLGSRSTDILSGLGPAALRAGDRVGVGAASGEPGSVATSPPASGAAQLSICWGPREDWFADPARQLLVTARWTVRPDSDRIGVRLDGPALPRARTGELPSEPTLPGAVQIPANGRPIVFGPDAPVTGGYPVIAVVDDLDLVAQLRAGDTVQFTPARRGTNPTLRPRPAPPRAR